MLQGLVPAVTNVTTTNNSADAVVQSLTVPGTAASVIIVNHNTRLQLEQLLASLQANDCEEIIIVDNASDDGSQTLVRLRYPDVTLIANEHNPGYGSAANQGVAASRGEIVVLLNSDTVLQPDSITRLVEYVERHPDVAIAGPVLVGTDGMVQHSWRQFPNLKDDFLLETGLRRYIRRHPIKRLRRNNDPRGAAMRVDWIVGAALAIRRSAFESVGGFDESYFMYFEEVDLCRRLQALGWEIHYTPVTTVMHVGGASSNTRRAEMLAEFIASQRKYYRQHYSGLYKLLLLLSLQVGLFRRIVRDAIRWYRTNDPAVRQILSEDCSVRWRSLTCR